jgi:hypothetical protein
MRKYQKDYQIPNCQEPVESHCSLLALIILPDVASNRIKKIK